MRWQSLGLLAFILAALGAAYYALETKGTLFGSDTNRLFQADEKDVEKITITRGEARIVLKREGNLSADQAGGWRLIEPVQATADASETTSLLRTLLESTEERRIEEAPSRLADYGLERPSLQLSVTLKNQKTLPALLLGDLNPNGRSVYAKRPDQPRSSWRLSSYASAQTERRTIFVTRPYSRWSRTRLPRSSWPVRDNRSASARLQGRVGDE